MLHNERGNKIHTNISQWAGYLKSQYYYCCCCCYGCCCGITALTSWPYVCIATATATATALANGILWKQIAIWLCFLSFFHLMLSFLQLWPYSYSAVHSMAIWWPDANKAISESANCKRVWKVGEKKRKSIENIKRVQLQLQNREMPTTTTTPTKRHCFSYDFVRMQPPVPPTFRTLRTSVSWPNKLLLLFCLTRWCVFVARGWWHCIGDNERQQHFVCQLFDRLLLWCLNLLQANGVTAGIQISTLRLRASVYGDTLTVMYSHGATVCVCVYSF